MKLLDLPNGNSLPNVEIQRQSHFQMVTILKSFFAMLAGEGDLTVIDEMSDALVETPAFELTTQSLKRDPDCATLIRDRYIPPAHDLDWLLTYPPDSLGYIYAATLRQKGFDPNLHAGKTASSDARYVELRLGQTHDLWHIVTGFDTSPIDEIGLQAFSLAQFQYPLSTVLVANSLMSTTLLEPESLPPLLEAIAKGWQMGKAAKPLFAQKWEEGWERPLTQWQAELNIQPGQ